MCCICYSIRARITGTTDTATTPQLLELIQNWILNDATFLFTYHGNMRLGLDRECPLEITSFSQPECKNSNFIEDMKDEL